MGNSFQQNRFQPEKKALPKAFIFSAFLFLFLVLTAGCMQQPLPEAGTPPAHLYAGKCGLCHEPFHPQTHTYIGWKKVIPRMEQNAEAHGITEFLSGDEKASILAYLEKHARKGF
ncbi:MAG TPA: hypothetical protein VI728_06860 [Syntrophales bacterium]|nr:hypothetical protein [Syntrophales bacterium]